MIRYYPSSRVKTNQTTTGDDFALNGVPYVGPYYETYDGQAFSGKDPIQGPSAKLTKREVREQENDFDTPASNTLVPSKASDTYLSVNKSPSNLETYDTPQPYYPQPTQADYTRRFIMRYFAKKRDRPGYIIEVDKDTHDSLKSTDSKYDYVTYEAISTFWQIAGPLHDTRPTGHYTVAGIIDTNKRLITSKDPSFPGLIAYIGDEYTKFSKPAE